MACWAVARPPPPLSQWGGLISLTNEELALLIQNGDTGLFTDLWDQIERLCKWWSTRYAHKLAVSGIVHDEKDAFDDLFYGCCFPALHEAVNHYDPGKGNFVQLLFYYFKNEAAGMFGYKTSKRDAALFAISLNQPLRKDNEKLELKDTIPDPADQFEAPEHRIYLEQLHEALEAALDDLTEDQANVIRLHYFHGLSCSQIAAGFGVDRRETVNTEQKAIRQIRSGNHTQQLRSFMRYDYYSEGLRGTGPTTFRNTGTSATERAALKAIKDKSSG